jgi:hypothetical protein
MALLYCLPGFAATVYKAIDENGVVSYSDTRPPENILVETIVINIEDPPSDDQAQQRLQDMRETTDRMAVDRMAREKHRAEMQQLQAQTDAQQASQEYPQYYDSSAIYSGYYNYPVRHPRWRTYRPRPEHPIARPPLRPPHLQPLPKNNFPAPHIRPLFTPKVRGAR